MAYSKARDLLRLAEMAAARHGGVSLAEVAAEFEVDHRTAQRMTRALEEVFAGAEVSTDDDRRRRWRLRDAGLGRLRGLRDSELAALEMSIRAAERDGRPVDAAALASLRDRLLAAMPPPHARRAEADAEALLEAQGYAARPGPRVQTAPGVAEVIAEALKGPFRMAIRYRGAGEEAAGEREIEPYGLLIGLRRYLVARQPEKDDRLRNFRVDRIEAARLIGQSFARDPGFDLETYAVRAFGAFHDPAEHGEVIWRFAPHAVATAREFVFHPEQVLEDLPDGGLLVRFAASGLLEMAWHLYMWGDAVRVLAPERLRRMVEAHRRDDFAAFP